MTVNDSGAPIARQNPMHVKHSTCPGQMAPNVLREWYVSLYLTVSSKSLSPSLCLRLCLYLSLFQKTPPYFSLSLQLPSTSHPYPHLFMLTDWAKMERPSTDTWTIFLPIGFGFWSWNHFIAHIFSNLWHIPSLIYRIKGKFKKHLCTFNYLSFYRHS